jgi:transcriptional regulator with XRE-family HTH domain
LGIKQQDFAKKIQFTQSYVSMVISGSKTSPSDRFFNAICREFYVNLEWIKSGKGEVYNVPGVSASSVNTEILAKYRLLPRSEQQMVEEIIDAFLLKTMSNKKGN